MYIMYPIYLYAIRICIYETVCAIHYLKLRDSPRLFIIIIITIIVPIVVVAGTIIYV